MSAPDLQGQWFTRANALFPSTTSALEINNSWAFMLKELLKGTSLSGTEGRVARPTASFWVVIGSSDGTAAALDGVDRLTGSVPHSYDSSKWVHAASGSAHSWIVLKSPEQLGPVYLCIDANSATTTTYGIIGARSPFVLTAPLHTASRPHVNNAWCAGTTTDPTQTTNIAVTGDQNPGAIYRAHISVDISGAFNFMTSRDGAGVFHSFLACFNQVDRNANDNSFHTFFMFHASTSGRGAPLWSTVGVTAGNCNGRTVDGVAIHGTGGFSSWIFGSSSSNFAGAASPDLGYVNMRFLPIYIHTFVTNKHAWRGRTPDRWVVGAAPVGYAYPSVSAPTQHVVGDIIVPLSVRPIL